MAISIIEVNINLLVYKQKKQQQKQYLKIAVWHYIL